jgi:hypothetical protein
MKRILFAVLLLLGGDATAVVFDDGQLHVIDAANSFPLESVFILDGPAQATTAVTIVDGGVSCRGPRCRVMRADYESD